MKRTRSWIPLLAAGMMVVWFACDGIIIMPDEPEYKNPYNPDDREYVAPQIEIVSAPTETVDTTTVRISWQGIPDTLEFEYAYRHNEGDWSDWYPDTSLVLNYLDDRLHTFDVKSRYPQSSDESLPAETTFVVEALPPKSLYFHPYLTEASAGDTITLELRAKELAGLTAIEFTLEFDQSALSPLNTIPGAFLTSAVDSCDIVFSERNPYWHFNLGAVHGNEGWVPGSGSVISFRFEVVVSTKNTIDLVDVDARGPNDEGLSVIIRGAYLEPRE